MVNSSKRLDYLIKYEKEIIKFKEANTDINIRDFAGDLLFLNDIFYGKNGGYISVKVRNNFTNNTEFMSECFTKSEAEHDLNNFMLGKNKDEYSFIVRTHKYKLTGDMYIPFGYYFNKYTKETDIASLYFYDDRYREIITCNIKFFQIANKNFYDTCFITLDKFKELNEYLLY